MAQTYYVIELTLKWLILLLAGLALLIVLAFAGGYGAAYSVLRSAGKGAVPEVAPAVETVEVQARKTPAVVLSEATPVPPKPTLPPTASGVAKAKKHRVQQPSPQAPTPTTPPKPTPTRTARAARHKSSPTTFWVQVLASRHAETIEKARKRLKDVGFPRDHQRVVKSKAAGGSILLKLRVGPFPDRESAERVRQRLRRQKFPDAWVVTP